MANQADNLNPRIAHEADQRPLHQVTNYGIVLVGQTGSGKSATGNTILGRNAFKATPSGESVTGVSSYATSEYGDRTITVVDTPGLHDNVRSDSIVKRENARIAFLLREGVHCFVICINGSDPRVTKETKQFLKQVKVSGDVDFFDYCMLVYTKAEVEIFDMTLNSFLDEQKRNKDMKSFLRKIGDKVLAVNNKANDPREQTQYQAKIIAIVDKMIKDNITSNNSAVFTDDTLNKAKELREKVVEIVENQNCHPSLVNAVVEAVIWFSYWGTVAEEEFVEKVITILCKSDQCEKISRHLVFKNDERVTTISVADCENHIKMIYKEIKSNIGLFYKMLGTILKYKKTYIVTSVAATAGAGFLAGAIGMGLMGAILGVPAVIAYGIGKKMS